MLRPLPMKHVRLLCLADDLPRASLTLAETAAFHPDDRPPDEQALSSVPGRAYRELFQTARSRLDKIVKLIGLDAEPLINDVRVIDLDELGSVTETLGQRWQEASHFEEDLRYLDEEERSLKDQQSALAKFENLHVDLRTLRNKTRFLDFYVGVVPRENLRSLEGAVELADHLLFPYLQSGDHAHVVIVGPTGAKEAQLNSVLSSAGFQRLPIPHGEDAGDPVRLAAELTERRSLLGKRRAAVRIDLAAWRDSHRDELEQLKGALRLAEPLVTLDPAIRSHGQLAHLAGWVPARAVADLRLRLEGGLQHPFALDERKPRADERELVPTVPVKSRLLKPFALLVNQYGIPGYGEVDPTPLFAVTFLLMFGSMFGDLGQGALIAGLAWWFRGKLGSFWLFGLLAGLSSMLFGVLYGSVFGYEERFFPALWMSPLHDPILMLKIALGWGVLFIVVACSLAIYNRAAIGNWIGALLGHHGAVNLVFYLALIRGGLSLSTTGTFGWLPTILIVLSLGLLAVHSWREQQAPVGEKVLVVFIETLETIIGYVSNTLSFLRVAAFSLNHVALSIAVFTLAGMMGAFGHVVTVILGNVFVLVLEGGIVMIQVMRLQYYEGFSRYFSGEGHEFAPLRLRTGQRQ